jgi:hypothetical protein
MDGRRRDAIIEIGTIIRRLRQARGAIKNGDLSEIRRLIDIAGMRARLVIRDLDKR